MNERFDFVKAEVADIDEVMAIIRDAQAQMRRAGSDQWQNGYPASGDIMRDMEHGCGYLLRDVGSGCVAAYGAVIFTGESAYNDICGRWITDGDYVVLHRLAVAEELKRQGVAADYFHRVAAMARERGVPSFRVDTNFDNRIMLRLLEREGFVYCGKIHYPSGERLAFELPL